MPERFDNTGFKATTSHIQDAVLITDPEGRITWANRAFKKLCGYNLKEIIGQNPGTFLQGKNTDPETVKSMHEAMEQRQHFHCEVLNYHKKGHAYWASISVTPFFDEKGSLQGHIGVAHDITKKRIEISQMENDIVTMYAALISESYSKDSSPPEDPFLAHMRFSAWSLSPEPTSAEPHRKSRL
jgi:PAS domain S-box-containing protein